MLLFVEFSKPIGNYCEATSASFGMTSKQIAGGGSHRAQADDFSFTKNSDSLSHQMMKHAANGTIFKTVTVEFYKTATSGLYVLYTFTDAMITWYHYSESSESVGLNFTKSSSKYYI